ncbi:ABC transporter permease [Pontibacter rugosus]|uniref:ABC transporter permease n=1 Tax=Pontibacter rugosus TaxID=1745966 RepID=A0ABW3ST10_9BACT
MVALFVLGTTLFLLSRLLPGSFGEERILQREASYYSTSDENSRRKAYFRFQQRAGLDKPVFYVSISPAALPDTVQQIVPEARRRQLEVLTFLYGNWPAVSAYDAHVNQLYAQLDPKEKQKLGPELQTLRSSTNIKELRQALNKTTKAIGSSASKPIAAIEQQLQTLENNASTSFLVPQLQWHGTNNQYHQWLADILKGEFGSSYRTGRPVLEMIWEAIGNTFWLLLCSMAITIVLGLELSIQMVKGRMHWLRRLTLPSLFILDSIPLFVLALLLLVLFANPDFLQLFPMYGMGYYMPQTLTIWQQLTQWFQFMALPMICLILVNLPYIANQIYTSLQATLGSDYIRTAKAKGLPEHRIIRSHAFRNSLIPLITIVSDFLPALVDGAFIIETVFAIPGIGRLLVESVVARDYPVLLAVVLIILTVRMFAYALADIGYAWADPRVKEQAA